MSFFGDMWGPKFCHGKRRSERLPGRGAGPRRDSGSERLQGIVRRVGRLKVSVPIGLMLFRMLLGHPLQDDHLFAPDPVEQPISEHDRLHAVIMARLNELLHCIPDDAENQA